MSWQDEYKELGYTRHKLRQSHLSTIFKHHEEEQGPTTDESQTEALTASTLLAQAADLEPIPWSKEKQKKNSKTRNIALASWSSQNLYLQLLL